VIRDNGIARLKEELRAGRISIHAGWKIAKMSRADQEGRLGWKRTRARRKKRLDKLLSLAEPPSQRLADVLCQLGMLLQQIKTNKRLVKLAGQIDALLLEIEGELGKDENAA